MNEERLMKVLLGPHVSEKGTRVGELHQQIVFKVVSDASKPEIKRAVEKMFDVQVDAVRVLNVKGKRKGVGRARGRRKDWKKAYVSLKPGQDIDFLAGE